MKRFIAIAVTLSFVLYLSSATTYAQHGRTDRPAVQDRRGDVHDARSPRDIQRDTRQHDQRQAEDRQHDQRHATEKHDVDRDQKTDARHDVNRDRELDQAHWDRNPQLREKLQDMLPGVDLAGAASGFKTKGQFIAAVNASHNLGIPFSDLKTRMTGPNAKSLGEAIHQLKPDIDAKKQAAKAEEQAKIMAKIKPTS